MALFCECMPQCARKRLTPSLSYVELKSPENCVPTKFESFAITVAIRAISLRTPIFSVNAISPTIDDCRVSARIGAMPVWVWLYACRGRYGVPQHSSCGGGLSGICVQWEFLCGGPCITPQPKMHATPDGQDARNVSNCTSSASHSCC